MPPLKTKLQCADEQELLLLTRENNQLLKLILRLVLHDEGNDFLTNVVANLLSNRIDYRYAA